MATPNKGGEGGRKSVIAALFGNLLIAITKFIAAAISGSSSMLTEGVHSLVDTGNQVLLIHGMHRASRPADARHPLGYGRELYFWSFIVALLIFALGAGVSIYEGLVHIRHPEPMQNLAISYGVLALSAVFEGFSWSVAFREFRQTKGNRGWWQAIRASKDPPTFIVLFEDSAAMIGLAIAALGITLAWLTGNPFWDGAASVLIGLVLGTVAMLLAREAKGLLIGERADAGLARDISAIATAHPGVVRTNGLMTTQLAPDAVVAALSVEFEDRLRAPEIEAAVSEIEAAITRKRPEVTALFVKPQTPEGFARTAMARSGAASSGEGGGNADNG